MLKNYRYVGEARINGVSFRNGTEILLHYGETYTLDDSEAFVQTLLKKRDANGMPRPWLVEVEATTTGHAASEAEEADENESTKQQPTKRSK